MTAPGIDLVAAPAGATDLVLLAHGGMENSTAAPHVWRPPILRMWPFAVAARSAAPRAAIGLVRYRYQGWNGSAAHPAADLRAVLDRLALRYDRVILIGHSMGGRAVVAAGNHPLVGGVLALAPWLPVGEPLVALRGPVVFAHGTADRITSLAATTAYARRLRTAGVPVAMLPVEGEKHAMLYRAKDWDELVRRFVTYALDADGTCPALTTDADRVDPLPTWHSAGALPLGVAQIAASRLRLPVIDTL
ncbi:hypothetical protein Kfla_6034 [Kribbella flavida DSM 17836]|uniref:AB hydrolase-1 domain-containing protein n=1 Tax=Kribbella flavida (strain DSM 17836 / JCM 10339 / NBRC 14399) TaxID=479435 RepID=D2PSY5_KRIFD|nr:alpha/beta fold hydrolase [Kribbella flavida]ADB35037.1 hypothetical protein Kfla_6034 [Kribbella flavida DSM 17836]